MVVRISGRRDFSIALHILVSQENEIHYPILNTPDNVNGIAYRTVS